MPPPRFFLLGTVVCTAEMLKDDRRADQMREEIAPHRDERYVAAPIRGRDSHRCGRPWPPRCRQGTSGRYRSDTTSGVIARLLRPTKRQLADDLFLEKGGADSPHPSAAVHIWRVSRLSIPQPSARDRSRSSRWLPKWLPKAPRETSITCQLRPRWPPLRASAYLAEGSRERRSTNSWIGASRDFAWVNARTRAAFESGATSQRRVLNWRCGERARGPRPRRRSADAATLPTAPRPTPPSS